MSVQARFFVASVEKFAYPSPSGWAEPKPVVTVKLRVVSSGGSRGKINSEWASATPHGEITMTIGNPESAAWFEEQLGRDLAVSFDERPADEIE